MSEHLSTLYIVRHGQSEGNAHKEKGVLLEKKELGSDLTSLGVEQASQTAKLLESVQFDKVFSSDLTRAHRTAQILVENKNLAIETTKVLRERSRGKLVGDLETTIAKRLGNIFDEMELMSPDEQNVLKYKYDIELRHETTSRVITFLREVAIAYPGKTILITCHGAIMRALLIHLGYGLPEELPSGSVKNASYFTIDSDGVDFFLKDTYGIEKRKKDVSHN